MKKSDVLEVSRLLILCYKWTGGQDSFPPEFIDFLISKRGSIETVVSESRDQEYYIALDKNKIVGMVAFIDSKMTKLYVHPDWHRKGIGRRLFNKAVDLIKNNGFDSVSAYLLSESSIPFYEAMGMTMVEREKADFKMYPGQVRIKMAKTI